MKKKEFDLCVTPVSCRPRNPTCSLLVSMGGATVRQARSSSAVSLLKVLRPGRYFNALAVEVVETETTFLKPLKSLSLVSRVFWKEDDIQQHISIKQVFVKEPYEFPSSGTQKLPSLTGPLFVAEGSLEQQDEEINKKKFQKHSRGLRVGISFINITKYRGCIYTSQKKTHFRSHKSKPTWWGKITGVSTVWWMVSGPKRRMSISLRSWLGGQDSRSFKKKKLPGRNWWVNERHTKIWKDDQTRQLCGLKHRYASPQSLWKKQWTEERYPTARSTSKDKNLRGTVYQGVRRCLT